MTSCILDTSAVIDLERAPKNVSQLWAFNMLANAYRYREQQGLFSVSATTYFEILGSVARLEPDAYSMRSRNLKSAFSILLPTIETYDVASRIYGGLEKLGLRIGVCDTFIAATAIEHSLTLVTSNTSHFQRVQAAGFELKMQNWRLS